MGKTAEKTLEQRMDEEYIPMIESMIEKEKELQKYLSCEIERMKNSKYGKFMNFIFPFHNDTVDELVLVIHSFMKESERLQANMEYRVKEYKKYFLNKN
jgi:hypothetical protein